MCILSIYREPNLFPPPINTYYRLFELANAASSDACDLLLFELAFPFLRFSIPFLCVSCQCESECEKNRFLFRLLGEKRSKTIKA